MESGALSESTGAVRRATVLAYETVVNARSHPPGSIKLVLSKGVSNAAELAEMLSGEASAACEDGDLCVAIIALLKQNRVSHEEEYRAFIFRASGVVNDPDESPSHSSLLIRNVEIEMGEANPARIDEQVDSITHTESKNGPVLV